MTSVPPDDVDPQGLTAAEIPEGIMRAIRKHQEDTHRRYGARHRPRAHTTLELGIRPPKAYYAECVSPCDWRYPRVGYIEPSVTVDPVPPDGALPG